MTHAKLKSTIHEILSKLDEIVTSESSLAAMEIKKLLNEVLENIEEKAANKNRIYSSSRLLLEAPPANIELGKDILAQLDRVYASL